MALHRCSARGSVHARGRHTHTGRGRALVACVARCRRRRQHIPDATSLVAGKSEEELEDELPWQLIALLDAAITRDLLRSHAWREHKVERARTGQDLPRLAAASLEAIAADEGGSGLALPRGTRGRGALRGAGRPPARLARPRIATRESSRRRASGCGARTASGCGPSDVSETAAHAGARRRCPTRQRPTRSSIGHSKPGSRVRAPLKPSAKRTTAPRKRRRRSRRRSCPRNERGSRRR